MTYRPPPIGYWSKCGGNDIVMVLDPRRPREWDWGLGTRESVTANNKICI